MASASSSAVLSEMTGTASGPSPNSRDSWLRRGAWPARKARAPTANSDVSSSSAAMTSGASVVITRILPRAVRRWLMRGGRLEVGTLDGRPGQLLGVVQVVVLAGHDPLGVEPATGLDD